MMFQLKQYGKDFATLSTWSKALRDAKELAAASGESVQILECGRHVALIDKFGRILE